MWIRSVVCAAVTAATLALGAAPVGAVTLQLNVSGGSVADPITDSLGSALDPGNQIFLYRTSTALGSSDLFSNIFLILPGGGLSFVTAGNVLLTTSIGTGISPPINLDGRVRGQFDLGNLESPTVASGTLLYLIAINASGLALATEAGIASESFTVPTLPGMNDAPPLPVDYVASGFETVPVPEPATGLLLLSGLGFLTLRRRRLLRASEAGYRKP